MKRARTTAQIIIWAIGVIALGVLALFWRQNADTQVHVFLALPFKVFETSQPLRLPNLLFGTFASGFLLAWLTAAFPLMRARGRLKKQAHLLPAAPEPAAPAPHPDEAL